MEAAERCELAAGRRSTRAAASRCSSAPHAGRSAASRRRTSPGGSRPRSSAPTAARRARHRADLRAGDPALAAADIREPPRRGRATIPSTSPSSSATLTRFTLTVYTKAVKRRAKLSGEYLAEYERALAWAASRRPNGHNGHWARIRGRGAHGATLGLGLEQTHTRRLGGVVTQRPAKPFTPVRFRQAPLDETRANSGVW